MYVCMYVCIYRSIVQLFIRRWLLLHLWQSTAADRRRHELIVSDMRQWHECVAAKMELKWKRKRARKRQNAHTHTYTHIHISTRASPIEHLSELRVFCAPFFLHAFVVVFNCHLSHSILIYYYCHFNKYTSSNATQPPRHGGGFDTNVRLRAPPYLNTLPLARSLARSLASFTVRLLQCFIALPLRFSLGK